MTADGKFLTLDDYRAVRAFVNSMADACATCLRRAPERCRECDLLGAGDALARLDGAEGTPPPGELAVRRMGFAPRARRILRELLEKGPCAAREIDAADYGSRGNKHRCLKILVRRGLATVRTDALGVPVYDVNRERLDIVRAVAGGAP